MGNSKSTAIKDHYNTQQYRVIIQHTDPYIGPYQLIKFTNMGTVLYLRTTLEPTKYDHYNCDYDLFSSKMHNGCRNICSFEFLNESSVQAQGYDLLFEFGNYINTNFQKEEVIWDFINGIIEGLIFLQAEGLHYPVLRKRYTTFVSETNTFKLLNPFCFLDFIDKAIGLYFNCDVDLIAKADYSRQCINRNVKEFAIMILALIKNVDESHFIKNPSLIKPSIKDLRGLYSDELVNLLAFIIRSREPINFIDLRNFIDQTADRLFNSVGSKESFPGLNRKIQMNDTQSSLNTHYTYSEANLHRGEKLNRQQNQYNQNLRTTGSYKNVNYRSSIDPNNQTQPNNPIKFGENQNVLKYEETNNLRANSYSAPLNISFLTDSLDHKAPDYTSMVGCLQPVRVTAPSPKVEDLNLNEEAGKGLQSDIQDLRGLHKTIQDISSINKIPKSSYHEALEKKAKESVQRPADPKDDVIIETHADNDSKSSLLGRHKNNINKEIQESQAQAKQPAYQPPVNKKVKRILMKWVVSENKHKEFIEYEDGTLEEKQGADAKEIKNVVNDYYKRNDISKPGYVETGNTNEDHKPKKSAMHFDVRTIEAGDELPQIVNKNNYNIILFSTEPKEPPKVIFTSSINRAYLAYEFMKGVVDFKSALKLSKYHQDVDY